MSETTETKIETAAPVTPEAPTPGPEATTPTPASSPEIPEDFEPENVFARAKRAFAELGRAFSGRPDRAGWELSCFQLLDMSGERIISAGDLEKLREFQRRHDNALQVMQTRGADDAHRRWLEQNAFLPQAIGQGVSNHEVKTEADFLQHNAHLQQGARDEQRRVYQECLGLCQFVADRFCAVANKMIAAFEKREKQNHARFGVHYNRPSDLIVALKRAVAVAESRTNETANGNQSPRAMLPYLDI